MLRCVRYLLACAILAMPLAFAATVNAAQPPAVESSDPALRVKAAEQGNATAQYHLARTTADIALRNLVLRESRSYRGSISARTSAAVSVWRAVSAAATR